MSTLLATAFAACAPFPAMAGLVAPSSCIDAERTVEQHSALPHALLHAIALVESGRPDPRTGALTPWPWTINVGGVGSFYASKAEAVAAARALTAAGNTAIDVGCMQINLGYHPHAFSSLDDAFEPATNVAYAADFLSTLHQQMGSWPKAAAAYHSQTPTIGAEYERRVMALWPLSGAYADGLPDPAVLARQAHPNWGQAMISLHQQDAADRARLSTMFGRR